MSGSGFPPRLQSDAGDGQQSSNSSSSNNNVGETRAPRTEQELAQAFRDLARGEQTAAALEANLTSLESKLDELLASFEAPAAAAAAAVPAASSTNGDEKGGSAAAGKSETGEAGQKKDG